MSLEIDLLIGGIAGIISRTATAPLELYKIQQQNNYLKNSTIKNVLNKEIYDKIKQQYETDDYFPIHRK